MPGGYVFFNSGNLLFSNNVLLKKDHRRKNKNTDSHHLTTHKAFPEIVGLEYTHGI